MDDREKSHENLIRHERASSSIVRVVCGGQSGVDRAAVDFAFAYGVPYGGWVPRGGWAEDYPDPPGVLTRYGDFRATETSNPDVRTALNVRDATATLIIRNGDAWSPGTEMTVRAAVHFSRALLVVDALGPHATTQLRGFLSEHGPPTVLNVAGPRESECPGMYEVTFALLASNADLFDGAVRGRTT